MNRRDYIHGGLEEAIALCLHDDDPPHMVSLPAGMAGTPERVLRAWQEMTTGYRVDTRALLRTEFDSEYDEVVALRAVPFHSLCEHHLLPFHGTAAVAYLPKGGKVVGLSKLARLVEAHARRFQIQERMTRDIAADVQSALEPRGVAVLVRARHSCMEARGVCKPGAEMVTTALLGLFKDDARARAEVLALFDA